MSKRALNARRGPTASAARVAGTSRPKRTSSGRSNLQVLRALGARPTLTVGQPADPEEQEADRAAETCAAGQAVLRSRSGGCAEEETVQRSASGPAPRALSLPRRTVVRGGGEALPVGTRQRYERFFGAELSAVRVHTGAPAGRIADRLGARAFAVGPDVVFGRGQFAPQTDDGSRLLAHELAHVVQRGGGARDVKPSETDVMAQGGLTDRDLEAIRDWLQADEQATATEEWRFPGPRREPNPFGFRLPGPGTESDPSLIPVRRWDRELRPPEPIDPERPSHPARQPPVRWAGERDICPSCHQTSAELRAARARREADAAAERRRRAWHGLHREQHAEDLAGQRLSLREDVRTSAVAAAQLRVRMFDAVLQQQDVSQGWGVPARGMTPELRDAWVAAQQAITVLEALIRAADAELPADIVAPVREVLATYYATLAVVLRERDRDEAELERMLESLRPRPTGPAPCPGCHEQAPSPSPFDTGRSWLGPGAGTEAQASRRMSRLEAATARNAAAASRADWRLVLGDYRWTVTEIDAVLRSRLSQRQEDKDLVEQFDFTRALLERQQRFLEENPEALKVQAVFYPREDVVDRPDGQGGTRLAARAIPWHFYLTRTPVTDSRYVPIGYEWKLHDLTAPRRDQRYVKTTYQVTAIEALARERGPWQDPRPIDQMDPPAALFDELNHRDFFPKGMLYWTYPLSGRPGTLETTAPRPFGEWLTLIGMAVALLGGLVFAPFSIPMLLAVGGGTALSITGRVIRRDEMERHGVLTEADTNRFYWDLTLDIVNALTLGLGRVATVSIQAGNALRAAQATRYYFMVRRAQIALDVVNVGVVTHDFVQQYRAIQDSKMSPEEKSEALRDLTLHGLLAGGLTLMMLRGAAHDLRPGARLRVDVDPSRPGRFVADIEPAAGPPPTAGPRARADARRLSRITVTDTARAESHEITVWSDGRITRCSPPPCLIMADSVAGRLDELGDRMLSISRHRATMEDLAARTRRLREEAEQLADVPHAPQLEARSRAIVERARAIDAEINALELRVARENEIAAVRGHDEAFARYGDAALAYDRAHYRWVFDRETGLQFQRRSQAVPWMAFENGQFVVTRTLFEPVSAQRLAEVRAGGVTSQPDFRIAQVVDRVEDLRRLRPYSPTPQRPPRDWVLVRINDENLVHFYTEPVPHGAIFEFPDGARVWRTPQNTIATDAPVRAPIGRRGFEQSVPPERTSDAPTDVGIPSRQATGVEHQRAHPRGQGTGFELFNHIPLAPTYVNQVLQARGIELYISELHRLRPDLDLRFHTEHSLFPGTRRQAWIDYHLYVVRDGAPNRLFTLRIGTDYSNPRAPAAVEFRNVSRRPDDVAILDSPDMRAARAALEQRIRDAIARRTTGR